MSKSSQNKEDNDFDESDEEYPRHEFGSSKWSSTSSSLSSSAANEATTPIKTPREESLDPDLVDYLIQHKKDVTLISIKAIQELLSELRLSQPDRDTLEHISELRARYTKYEGADDIRKELDELKKSKRLIEMKLQISRKVHADELKLFDNNKMDDLLKNNGAREYVQSLKERVKSKEESVDTLRRELDYLRKEVDNLRERCSRSTKLSNHYFQLYKDAEAARSKLESLPMIRERNINNDRMQFVSSPANSLDDSQVPPPPPIDMPTLDEILGRDVKSPPLASIHPFNSSQQQPNHDNRYNSSANNSQYNSFSMLDNSIPPPPLDDVDLDEILGHLDHSDQQHSIPPLGSIHSVSHLSNS